MINKYKVMPKEAIANNVDDVVDQFIAGRYAIATMPFARYSQVGKPGEVGRRQPRHIAVAGWTADKPVLSRCRAGGPQFGEVEEREGGGEFVEWMITGIRCMRGR